jgi:uncharacterized protein
MKRILAVSAVYALMSSAAFAEFGDLLKDDGELNPEEQTLSYFANKYDFKAGKSTACVYGYWATKAGNHADAMKIFDKCSQANVEAAMIWESYMYQNGYAVEKDLEKAAGQRVQVNAPLK